MHCKPEAKFKQSRVSFFDTTREYSPRARKRMIQIRIIVKFACHPGSQEQALKEEIDRTSKHTQFLPGFLAFALNSAIAPIF